MSRNEPGANALRLMELREDIASRHMNHCKCLTSVLVVIGLMSGCESRQVTVDDTPYREAIARYLQTNNMAMKIKEIKEGPASEGDAAKLTASMVHQQLAGPSVTWTFHFAKQSNGTWEVTRHEE